MINHLKQNITKHDETILIFVYGSLKQGFCNHHILKNTKYKATVKTKKRYGMFQEDSANYPYLIQKTSSSYHRIKGELYEVKSSIILKRLDSFEDAPNYYKRESIDVELSNGDIVKAQTYFIKDVKIPSDQTPLSEWKEDEDFYLKQFNTYYAKATACAS